MSLIAWLRPFLTRSSDTMRDAGKPISPLICTMVGPDPDKTIEQDAPNFEALREVPEESHFM